MSLSRIAVSLFFLTVTGCVTSRSEPPRGFVGPCGGASCVTKEMTPFFKQSLDLLKKNRAGGASAGEHFCLVEHDPGDDFERFSRKLEGIVAAAGHERFRAFVVNDGEAAGEVGLAREIRETCGIVFVTGGDQGAIVEKWNGSAFQEALRAVLARGGGILGYSAGGAILGSLLLAPRSERSGDKDLSTQAMLAGFRLDRSELVVDFVTAPLADLPPLYVETHAEERERSARALAILGAARSFDLPRAQEARAMVLDNGTAALVSHDGEGWVAEIFGGRAAEIVFPTARSLGGLSQEAFPYFTDAHQVVVLGGARVALTGRDAGRVLDAGPWAQQRKSKTPKGRPVAAAFATISGASLEDGEKHSPLRFEVQHAKSGERIPWSDHDEKADDYLEGRLVATPNENAGETLWMVQSFNFDFGRKRNRLPALRWSLGGGWADAAVGLPCGMRASGTLARGFRFEKLSNGTCGASSVVVYDVRGARNRFVSSYVYEEFGATRPVQIGGWERGRVHLVPPGGLFSSAGVALP